MCKNWFKLVYSPECELSFDEGCCAYKGYLCFHLYNPQKPNKFHKKLFQVNEALSGYILGFEVYTGKQSVSVAGQAVPLDVTCTRTTKLVLGLLASVGLLHKGHLCYMDNYYSSPELFQELYDVETYACGTIWKNRRGLPIAVSSAKLKKGESVFRRNGALLALKWAGKRAVYMVITIHDAKMVGTGKRHFNSNERIFKPEPVVQYISKMGGVDKGDQLMSYYLFLCRSVKCWRKLFVYMPNMLMLNAFILHNKFATEKTTHEGFREAVVKNLVEEGIKTCNLTLPPQISPRYEEDLRSERHYPSFIPAAIGAKRARPTRPCHVCVNLPVVDGVKLSKWWS